MALVLSDFKNFIEHSWHGSSKLSEASERRNRSHLPPGSPEKAATIVGSLFETVTEIKFPRELSLEPRPCGAVRLGEREGLG
jgi:hypothetical protein